MLGTGSLWSLRIAAGVHRHPLLALTTRNDEVIVIAVASPRTGRHIADFNKLPICYIGWCQPQIITDSRRNA